MLRQFPIILGIAAAVLAPSTALAVETQTFDFGAGQVNAQWKGLGPIQMQQDKDGIVLSTTDGTGFIVTSDQPKFLADGVTITASTQQFTDLYFVWLFTADGSQSYEIPFSLESGAGVFRTLSLTHDTNWHAGNKQIGIALPPHTAILLQTIDLHRWNIAEKAWEVFRSFWTFDGYNPYTINFLWGPQLGTTSIDRLQLFAFLPPAYPSMTYIAYGILVLLLVIFGVLSLRKPIGLRKSWFAKRALVMMLAAWILFDARMGSEFVSWVGHDWNTYISQPATIRTFRDRDDFYDFAEFAKPLIADRQTYLFFAEQQWPYLGNMRYLTYPSIPGIDIAKDDTWAIYHRSDMVVDQNNQLTIGGQVLTVPGKILGRFSQDSFVFRGAALPTAH